MAGRVLGTCSRGTTNMGYMVLGTTLSSSLTAPALLSPIPAMLSLGQLHRFSSVSTSVLNLCTLIYQDYSAPKGQWRIVEDCWLTDVQLILKGINKLYFTIEAQKNHLDSTNINNIYTCIKTPELHLHKSFLCGLNAVESKNIHGNSVTL